MLFFRIALTVLVVQFNSQLFAQDTSFVGEINRNFSRNLPRILALRSNNDASILTGPSGSGTKSFNTSLILLPDAYQTLDFSDTRALRYETYLPYKSKTSRDALFAFVHNILAKEPGQKAYSVESRIFEGERRTVWILRQDKGNEKIETEIRLWESHKQLVNEIYYLLTLNIANKQQNYKLRPGSDSTRLRLVQPSELVRLLAAELPNGLKPLSMYTHTKDSVEFYPFVQMPQFAVQPNASHLVNNNASWYAGQVRYEANRYFPDSKEEGLVFLESMRQLLRTSFSFEPEVLRYADNESIAYVWKDISLPYLVRLEYKSESALFPRQVNFNFKSSQEERNRYDFGLKLKAAGTGDAAAMNDVGVAYHAGVLVTKDYEKAVAYFKKAADAGSKIAMANYAMMRASGTGIKKDTKDAMKWYEKAAAGNYPFGLYKLALVHRAGEITRKDIANAISLLKIAADSNYMPAIKELATVYDDEEGYKDQALAALYFRVSSASRDGYSTTMLGYIHEKNGLTDSAFFYYNKALSQDYPHAWAFVADYRRNLKDFPAAWEAYHKGAAANNAYCMNKIGGIYFYGSGTITADRAKAREWYQRAANLGNQSAKESIEYMDKQDRPAPPNDWDE
ncbi:MAG: sel1 repeat family protein [Chitinophagaceae bacterium]|nr:MAG: sel1 repeat family protein [Chitinophagaceae bacterium]